MWAWLNWFRNKKPAENSRPLNPISYENPTKLLKKFNMLTDDQIKQKYGRPGDIANLTVIKLPYRMRIAWDLAVTVKSMQCHKLVAENFIDVFNSLNQEYGYERLKELGIDIFGGCYNFRKMRGGNRWSRHSWGIAIDLDPERNGLNTPWEKAEFSKPEYRPMIDIFYRNGFIGYGKERGFDAMHFEISS